jgi:transcriptional regulator of NAD metabolism
MARAVLLLIALVAARAKAGAVENARAEEQRDKREAIVRDNCIIRDWERWILRIVNNKETLLIMCHHS